MVEDLGDIMVNRAGDVNWVQVCSQLNVQMHLASAAAAGARQVSTELGELSHGSAMNNERHNRVNASNIGFKTAIGTRAACARARD